MFYLILTAGPSPRAWLGLESSESDGDDLFKPKFSSARKESLPQSPSVTSPAPRKKIQKKEPQSPKVIILNGWM